MAVVKICGTDEGCLSINSVRLCDVIHSVVEVCIGQLGVELAPLHHIFHGLHFCRFQMRVAGFVGKPVDIADGSVELSVPGANSLA